MIENSKHAFLTTELDPDLLSTPFRVQTNWYVITGAPCSGKTTLIEQLADRGCRTIPETARLYMENEIAAGRSFLEIREDVDTLERSLIEMQLRFERTLHDNDIAFLDRGLPDGLTYCRVAGMNPNKILSECFHHRYASIFMLDRCPYQKEGVRTGDDARADLLDEWLNRDYCALGYSVVRVPVLSPIDRLTFVLERISKKLK